MELGELTTTQLALVRCGKCENLDVLNVGWLGVFIAPTTKLAVWWRLLSLALGIKPEPEALYPKYPNPYPYSPKPVTRIAFAGNKTKYPN